MKYATDQGKRHPYLNPLFWIENQYWKEEYYEKFIEQQKRELERTGKLDLI